jgi:fucose permease
MPIEARHSQGRILAVLHPVFALTGVLVAIVGSLLPSLARTFHLSDSQSGLLLFLFFIGCSLGALLCKGSYARTITLGFAAIVVCCIAVATARWPWLLPAFWLLGIGVGVPMTAVNLFAGREFALRSASTLTLLNFSWSIGALMAPMLAGWILLHHSYRSTYLFLAAAAAVATAACFWFLKDGTDALNPTGQRAGPANFGLIVMFAAATFLEVGVENTAVAWLSTFAQRTSAAGDALAAAVSSFYWMGFLGSRGVASFVLFRMPPALMLRIAVATAFGAGTLLALAPWPAAKDMAMLLLGIALAPIFPLLVAGSLARGNQTSDSRWVLAAAGFGGSVLPWLAGWISSQMHSLRAGMLTIPAAQLLMLLLLPTLTRAQYAAGEQEPG